MPHQLQSKTFSFLFALLAFFNQFHSIHYELFHSSLLIDGLLLLLVFPWAEPLAAVPAHNPPNERSNQPINHQLRMGRLQSKKSINHQWNWMIWFDLFELLCRPWFDLNELVGLFSSLCGALRRAAATNPQFKESHQLIHQTAAASIKNKKIFIF